MEKVFSFEMWLATEQGKIMFKVNATYPGRNSFMALLNFLHGISSQNDVVEKLNLYEISRIHVSELRREDAYVDFGINEVRNNAGEMEGQR